MARDDELDEIGDILRSEAVWALLPGDLEQRILGEIRADRVAIGLTGTALMPTARAKGTLRQVPDGSLEITLYFTGLPSAKAVYRAWLGEGDGADVRAIGEFRLSGGKGQAVLRPAAAPPGATITVTMPGEDGPILVGELPR
ncbi:hypothetical protein [Kribbella sp. CA-294648]|uniref:hypothetical protein n=1 Tax=Kribbella sp. CA-294648 TaxID=3239948 RepID=UPI003D8C5EF3